MTRNPLNAERVRLAHFVFPEGLCSQTCELDHVVTLELGGADTLDNIWPCGPTCAPLPQRFFKEKDITADWTQYLQQTKAACGSKKCVTGVID